ncbi:MAG: RNA polymerase-binding protein DksA [Candidatus Sulfobium sp.]|jgi:DnaK suppressor protein
MASSKSTRTTKKVKSASTKSSEAKRGAPKKAAKTASSAASQKKTALSPKGKGKTIKEVKVKTSGTGKTRKSTLSDREKHIQKIKVKLLKQRESLLNEAESALNELPGQMIFPDLGDQATAETDRSFMLRLRGREQRLLKKIDEAVERIENGSFGICDDCGEEIDIKRLEARPVTTMCIECKTLQEEEEKLRES